jgi:hypothetical protein
MDRFVSRAIFVLRVRDTGSAVDCLLDGDGGVVMRG